MHAVLVALLFVLSSSVALARLGETLAQRDVRYGKPLFTGRDEELGLPQRVYRKNGILVSVVFLRGSCVQILFSQIPDVATAGALTARNSMGGTWKLGASAPDNSGHQMVSQANGRTVAEAWVRSPRFAGDTGAVMLMDHTFAKGKDQAAWFHSHLKAAQQTKGF